MNKRFWGLWVGLLMMQPCFASTSFATVTDKDVTVIARVGSLLGYAKEGKVSVAVISGGETDTGDAHDFLSIAGAGKQVGNVTLIAKKSGVGDADFGDAKVLFIPDGLTADQLDKIYALAQAKQLATVSTSSSCLEAKRCAMVVKSDPAVDITLSQSIANATGMTMGSTLRMMVKEVP